MASAYLAHAPLACPDTKIAMIRADWENRALAQEVAHEPAHACVAMCPSCMDGACKVRHAHFAYQTCLWCRSSSGACPGPSWVSTASRRGRACSSSGRSPWRLCRHRCRGRGRPSWPHPSSSGMGALFLNLILHQILIIPPQIRSIVAVRHAPKQFLKEDKRLSTFQHQRREERARQRGPRQVRINWLWAGGS